MLNILALRYISFSELSVLNTDYTPEYAEKNPEWFKDTLYQLGLDVNEPFKIQHDIQHRNQFGAVVTGSRVVGIERTDKAWVESGYASPEAMDKSKGNRLLVDLYRSKGLTDNLLDDDEE